MLRTALILLTVLVFTYCTQQTETTETAAATIEENPAAPSFNMDGSDQKAIEIADDVMVALGGREKWDNTRFICWNFFGSRDLIWDKWTGDVRIESSRDSSKYIFNYKTMVGRAMVKDQEITEPDSLKKLMERAYRIWVNDSYWLVMPYKLKDDGVTLKYMREDTTQSGISSDVLALYFEGVGVTPENHYEVWVDQQTDLVRQWAYYRNDTMVDPNIISPWNSWEKHGEIMLSGNRGGRRQLENIRVLTDVPENTFTNFDPVILE